MSTQIERLPVKTGHPRFNVAIVLILVAILMAFALVEAQRLALF